MRKPVYLSDDEWRTVVILNLIRLRQSIHHLAAIVGLIAVGTFAGRWWGMAPIGAASLAFVVAISAYFREEGHFQKLDDLHAEADR